MEAVNRILVAAIEGEAKAKNRYEAFARHAAGQGLSGIATLFAALAGAEAIHITNHGQALKKNGGSPVELKPAAGIEKSVAEDLTVAIAAEHEEVTSIYPALIRNIKKKHDSDFTARIAVLSLTWAMEAERVHLGLLRLALKKLKEGTDLTDGNFYLCGVCGNLVYAPTAPEAICPICGHDPHFYTRIEGVPSDGF